MARRPQRPCRYHTCRQLHRNGNGYCDRHQGEAGAWVRKPAAPTKTTERGYGWRWQKLRERILKRDGYLCQPCERAGRTTLAKEVDHILNKASGGDDSDDNLQAICSTCHYEKTAMESAAARGARI